MYRLVTTALLALALAAGCSHKHEKIAIAAEGVEVVRYADGVLVVKAEGKERSITFAAGRPHLHAADGKLVAEGDYATHLKPGVAVTLEEENGTVTEVHVKK